MRIVAAFGVALAALFLRAHPRWKALLIPVFFLASSFTFYVVHIEENLEYDVFVDIAGQDPALTITGIVIVVLLFAPTRESGTTITSGWLVILPCLAWLAASYLMWWEQTPFVRAGILTFSLALLAWILGRRVSDATLIDVDHARIVAKGMAAVFIMQLCVTIFQAITTAGDLDRMTGTFTHPAWLGKYAVLAMAILLPLTLREDRVTTRWSVVGLAAAFMATGFTLSRANLIALFGALIAWSVFHPSRRDSGLSRRLAMPLLVGLLSIPFISPLVERFELDPEGGDRQELWDAGIAVINRTFWVGTGPNNYVLVGMRTEPFIDYSRNPIHNFFMLGLAELGIVGVVLFVWPLLYTTIQSLRAWNSEFSLSAGTRAFAATGLGLVFISLTGWGLLQNSTLTAMFFVAGYSSGIASIGLGGVTLPEIGRLGSPKDRTAGLPLSRSWAGDSAAKRSSGRYKTRQYRTAFARPDAR